MPKVFGALFAVWKIHWLFVKQWLIYMLDAGDITRDGPPKYFSSFAASRYCG